MSGERKTKRIDYKRILKEKAYVLVLQKLKLKA